MKSQGTNFRHILCFVLVVLAAGIVPQTSQAQSAAISVSPTSLAFGIPTGSSPAVSIAQPVTVTITGSGSVTFTGASAGSPFAVSGNSCQGTLAAGTTCTVGVTFASTSTSLQTGTLHISATGFDDFLVSLSGAYGAIGLFGETNVTLSSNATNFGNLYPIANQPLNLSCPSTPAAKLSNTPDGSGYVFVDNYLTLSVGGNPVTSGNTPAGNVCSGGPADLNPDNGLYYNDCFSTNYQIPAGTNFGLNGLNPDTFVNPGNGVLATQPPNQNNAGGVPPIDISSFLSNGPVQTLFTSLDQGYVYGSSTVFLVTNCSLAGISPGGSSTGNAITPQNISSQTQTITFDAGPGQNISYNTSVANAVQAGTVTIPSGTTPVITDIGVPQSLFSQLVTGTSAAPAVCLRLTGEVDSLGQAMCKGYLVQCQFTDANGNTTITGDNCAPTPSTLRNLFDLVQFASPDAPVNGTNFLYGPVGSPAADACSNVVPGGSCAAGTGPGLLMGSDNWLCASGSSNDAPCTPLEPNTATPLIPATYSPANCALTGSLTGDLCPLNTLTQFEGAADGLIGGTTNGKNSLFIPVVNMPLPTTQTTVAGLNANGWINGSSINATFVSNQASYPTSGNIPGANSVLFAPPYSLTYGLSPASAPLPDPTYPVAGDLTNYNTGVNPNLQAPTCPSSGTPITFTSFGSFSPGQGVYNLHYFTTDCAYTEGLVFNPQGGALTNPTANWASFPVTSVGIDNVPPILSCPAPPPPNGTNGWYTTTNISITCSASDDFSGFSPGSPVAGTANSAAFPGVTTSPVFQGSPNASPIGHVTGSGAAAYIPQQTIQDLAGNSSNPQGPFPTPIDTVAPTIAVTYPSGNTFTVGQNNVSITYKCADTSSGVSSCAGQAAAPACPAAPTLGTPNYNFSSAINTSAGQIGTHTFNVTSTDCAGNVSSPAAVSYTITAPSADLLMGGVPVSAGNIKRGTTGNYYPFVLDLSSSTAYNVVITSQFTVPANILNGNLSATYWVGPCSLLGCSTNPSSAVPCSVTGTTITCNVGQVASVLKLQGVVVKVNIPVLSTATAGASFSSVTTVSSANDPKSSNNSVKQAFTVTK